MMRKILFMTLDISLPNADGIQMDIFVVTGPTSSCLFQANEVVYLQVS